MGQVVHVDFGGREPLLTRRQLAAELRCSMGHIENLERRGLPFDTRGRRKVYKETAVRNWMDRSDRKGIAHVG
jgi:hypothetical protein